MTTGLTASDLHFAYPDQPPALRGLSLTARRGRRLAILGPNGAGKTTLLQHLNGSLKPQQGRLTLDGTELRHDRAGLRDWRRRVALVLPDPDDQIFAPTVAEDISFGPLNLGVPEAEVQQRVAAMMAQFDLSALAHRPPHLLSTGQKKRVALAGALAMQPDFLLLDEPTAGLDQQGEERLLQLLDDLLQGGTSLIMTTHDAGLAWRWADDLALFRDGQVVANGPARAVLQDTDLLAKAGLTPPWQARLLRILPPDSLNKLDEDNDIFDYIQSVINLSSPSHGR